MYLLTVFWLTLKRITHNWRITTGLVFGLVLATGIISSIPIYSAGSLQRSFIREWLARDGFRPPFAIIVSHTNQFRKQPVDHDDLTRLERTVGSSLRRTIDGPVLNHAVFARIGSNPLIPRDAGQPDITSPKADLVETSNLRELSEIVSGRWYEPRDDGVVEVVVDESTFERYELLIGDEYRYWYRIREGESPHDAEGGYVDVPVEVVGMFRAKPGYTTADWIYPPPYSDRLFAHPEVFTRRLLEAYRLRVTSYDMQWVFDYSETRVGDLPRLIDAMDDLAERMEEMVPGTRFWHAPTEFFRSFNARRNLISKFLTALAVPVIGMIMYYLVLLASIAVEHRKREIVVMSSRGGGKTRIIMSFLLEWLVLGTAAVAAGPFLGMFIARVMGASTGFLQFADRTAVPAAFNGQSVLFSLVAVGLTVIAGMVPVFGVFRHSIVTYTRHYARFRRTTAWHRYLLDVVFLAVAAFGYYSLRWESFALSPGENVPADPVLFFVPVIGVLGTALLLLRIYPLIVHLVRRLTARFPGVVWRLAIQRLSRSTSEYVPLVLLLAVTLSLGVYSATTARTLAVNLEHTIRYQVGADLATVEEWYDPDQAPGAEASIREPPFLERTEMSGVVSAARVFRGRGDLREPERWSRRLTARLAAIDPYEFAETAWYRDDFGRGDFGDYLSLLARHREGVIVSTPIYEEAGLELGQPLIMTYRGQEMPVFVVGHMEFWPGIDPAEGPFFIMNIEHFQDYTVLEPYQVWYRLTDDASIETLVDELAREGIYVVSYRDARAEILEMKREPYRMGFFGMLGLGFVSAAVVTSLGFLIHTFFSVKRRTVQFGALQSMGLSPLQVLSLLASELVFTVGVGIALGFGLGIGASSVFLPFLRFRTADLQTAPPFLLVMDRGDIHTSLVVLGILFVVVVTALGIVLSRLKIHRAIKLGEEA